MRTVEDRSDVSATRPASRHARTALLVVAALVAGLAARNLISEGADSPLVRWLPWMNRTTINLYFGDETATNLVPVSRSVSREDSEPAAIFAALSAGPDPATGLSPVLPAGVKLASTDSDGCPLRQHVLAAQGAGSSMVYLAGFFSGAIVFHTIVSPLLGRVLP